MPSRGEVTNWGAGPAGIPTEVIETAAAALQDYNNTGIGIGEHSHRSSHAASIINEAKADLAKFLDIPDDYETLFLQAGGSGEFAATVYNAIGWWVTRQKAAIVKALSIEKDADQETLVAELKKKVASDLVLDYIVTGSWSLKAYQEAQRLVGPEHVNLVCDARTVSDGKFGKIPDESTWKLSNDAAMVYFCDNETVDGVEFPKFPESLKPRSDGSGPYVVADMSSNILSRPVDVKNYSVFYFGAQKNLGLAGITGVVLKKSLLPPTTPQPDPALLRQLGLPIPPLVLSYETAAKNNSLYNTLSIFDVFVAGQVLKKLLSDHSDKAKGQGEVSAKKAEVIYSALEAYPEVYRVVPDTAVRSRMNICFRVIKNGNPDESEKAFLKGAEALNMFGLKGHRSVGGMRASNYNSVTLESAYKLANYINSFAKE